MSNTFEILTRGRSAFNGEWYEGDVSYHRNGSVSIRPRENNVTGTGYYVEKETVSPYVQRTDKNGKKVFLGDICRYVGLEPGESGIEDCFFVGYYDKDGSFTIDGRGAEFLPNKQTFASEIEVVGNIWDNPEEYKKLLEVYENSRRKEVN